MGRIMNIKTLIKLLLLTVVVFTIGYAMAYYQLQDRFFTKEEIIEAHGSFDERINIIDERTSVLEDSTKRVK